MSDKVAHSVWLKHKELDKDGKKKLERFDFDSEEEARAFAKNKLELGDTVYSVAPTEKPSKTS